MMVAQLQRWIVLSVLLASIGALLIGWVTGYPVLGVSTAALLLFGYSLVLAAEFVCLAVVETSATRPGANDLIRAWVGEAFVAPLIFCWRQPFRASAEPDSLFQHPNQRGVLLVHGLVCNRGFWNPWIRRLRRLGVPSLAINLEPIFDSIESYAIAIDLAVQRLESATGMAPVIVAHSMGGLAVRHWLLARGAGHRIHRVVTVGTPHGGTWLARFGSGTSGRQMAIGSEWLAALDTATAAAGIAATFTCFYGDCDNVVFPVQHARLDGADNRLIHRTAHVALAFHDVVIAEVLRWLWVSPSDQSARSLVNTSPASSSPSDDTRR